MKTDDKLTDADMKVRAYSPVVDDWVTGSLTQIGETMYIIGKKDNDNEIRIHQVFKDTLTNYIGKNDRDDNELYSGDIVKIDYIPDLYYIYSCLGDKMDLVPLGYMNRGISFPDVEHIIMDMTTPGLMEHFEKTGNVLTPTIPRLMERWETEKNLENGSDLIIRDDDDFDEDDDVEYEDEDDFSVEIVEVDEPEVAAVSDLLSDKTDYRALSMDLTSWQYGKPYYTHTEDPGAPRCLIVEPATLKVHETVGSTLSERTKFIDKHGTDIFSGDVVLLEDSVLTVVKFVKEINAYCTMLYNIYNSSLNSDTENWARIHEQTWIENRKDIEIVGNLFTGLSAEFINRVQTSPDWKPDGLEEIDDIENTGLSEEDGGGVADTPVRAVARQIDKFVHNIRPDLTGFYYDDYNSLYTEYILHCSWTLPDGNEIHAYYNTVTGENAVHYGCYKPDPDMWKKHGVISYSQASFIDMINNIANLLMNGEESYVLEKSLKFRQNTSIEDYPMKKNKSYDSVIKDAQTISQKKYFREIRNCFSKKTLGLIEYRAQDCCGMWMHGHIVTTAGNNRLCTIYKEDDVLHEADRIIHEEYMTSSIGQNTFLTDRNGMFIYDCDIVDYDGRGRCIVYVNNDNDPNDVLNPTENETGEPYMYWMLYDEFEKCVGDPENHKLRWFMINPAEWIRNRNKITVVGNITESIKGDKSVVLNSDDFVHEEDGLSLMFEEDKILNMSKKAVKNMKKPEENLIYHIDDIELCCDMLGIDLTDENVDWRIYDISGNKKDVLKMLTVYITDTAEMRLLWNRQDMMTIMIGRYSSHTDFLGVHSFSSKFKKSIEDAKNFIADCPANTNVMVNAEFYLPDSNKRKELHTQITELAKNKELPEFSSHKSYIRYLKEHGYNMKSMLKCQCRAVNEYGRWMHGHPDPDAPELFIDEMTNTKERYLPETLGFNTYITDAAGKYIYDNDIVLFGSAESNNYFMIERKNWLETYSPVSFTKDRKKNIERMNQASFSDMYRCVYAAFADRMIDGDVREVQWVPCDINWFLRNTKRILVVGNTFTNNISVDNF